MTIRSLRLLLGIALLGSTALSSVARADGFALDRYEPSSAGEWTFAVEQPWYSNVRVFAGGLTLDYGHNPLVLGTVDASGNFHMTSAIVANQLVGHVDLAFSFLDRFLVSGSLPVTFVQSGDGGGGVTPGGASVGDPRLGVTARLYNHSDDLVSLHLGALLWIPIGADASNGGDKGVRFEPRLIASGLAGGVMRWAGSVGYLLRPTATIGNPASPDGATAGSELQVQLAVAYAQRNYSVGPELLIGTQPQNGHFFDGNYTSVEALLGGQYLVSDMIMVGAAAGLGILRDPGTPDFRLLLRVAYAPLASENKVVKPIDTDGDGILDSEDACPNEAGVRTDDPKTNGCPPPPQPPDRDHDGVADNFDLCPDLPMGDHPDPKRVGCPLVDTDKDGVFDDEDKCPTVPAGAHPDPKRPGCPSVDTDGDGIFDSEDECPTVPMGAHPDPMKVGCPLPDRDHDTVPDALDACPDKFGAPSPDPKKNGCPGLVQVKGGQIVILQQVFFATDKDVILPKSFPLLIAVADVLLAQPEIKRVAVEGHTDNQGKPEHNLDLSDRRAKSVVKFLIKKGIAPERLEAHGYGQTQPLNTNTTAKGRALNRRVVFSIVDPAPPTGSP